MLASELECRMVKMFFFECCLDGAASWNSCLERGAWACKGPPAGT